MQRSNEGSKPSVLKPLSGIGLATCKRIVERLGGRIWAEAANGKGAIFFFALPD
jgi:signal transduction histidine kinase